MQHDVCLKNLLGVLSGEKAPVGAGTFSPATPQVFFGAYIFKRIGVLYPVVGDPVSGNFGFLALINVGLYI